MNPNSTHEVLEELRDVLEDEGVEVTATYEVWVLSGQALNLRSDAKFAQRLHHQVRTSSGLIDARSRMGEICEIGNRSTATRIEAAAARLGKENLRLLLVPSRQIIALWNPDRSKLAVALSGTQIFNSESTLSEQDFELVLREMATSGHPTSGAAVQDPVRQDASHTVDVRRSARARVVPVYSQSQIDGLREKRFTTRFAGRQEVARAA